MHVTLQSNPQAAEERLQAPPSDVTEERCVSILGIRFHAFTVEEFTALVSRAIAEHRHWIFGAHNLHSLYLYHHDACMREFYNAARFFHADGMSLIMLGRLFGRKLQRDHRVTYLDWMDPLLQAAAEQGWRVFYLGSRQEVLERGIAVLKSRFPTLQIQGAQGHFDSRRRSSDNLRVIEAIRNYNPDLLMVGMGMPRQEHWVIDNISDLRAYAILTPGAAMDYIAGCVPSPPRWVGRIGLEWLFRFASEPRRLWRRYVLEPWFVLWLCLLHALGRGHFQSSRNRL